MASVLNPKEKVLKKSRNMAALKKYCGSEQLCGGNNPLSLVVVGAFLPGPARVSLDRCVAFSPVLFSSCVSTFGDISCCMPSWQLMESRSLDFLRRSSQQCSAVHHGCRDGSRLLWCCGRVHAIPWRIHCGFPVVLHDAHIASVAPAHVNSSVSDTPPVSCLAKTILLLATVAAV